MRKELEKRINYLDEEIKKETGHSIFEKSRNKDIVNSRKICVKVLLEVHGAIGDRTSGEFYFRSFSLGDLCKILEYKSHATIINLIEKADTDIKYYNLEKSYYRVLHKYERKFPTLSDSQIADRDTLVQKLRNLRSNLEEIERIVF